MLNVTFINIFRFQNNTETKIKSYFIKWCNVVQKQIKKKIVRLMTLLTNFNIKNRLTTQHSSLYLLINSLHQYLWLCNTH